MEKQKPFDYRLFLSLLLITCMPTIYETFRVFFISSIPSANAFNISGQIEWFDLIDETLRSFLIIPLYHILNQTLENREVFKERILGIGIFVSFIYFIFSIGVYVYASALVNMMTVPMQETQAITTYIRLETIAFTIAFLGQYFFVVFVLLGKHKYFFLLLIAKTTALIIGDSFFIPKFGVNGIAYSNMLTSVFIISMSLLFLKHEKLFSFRIRKQIFSSWMKSWSKIGLFSGGQIFLDNIVYALMIVKMVNEVADTGNYWVANGFIWGWLLVPIIALTEIIKRECKNECSTLPIKRYLKINVFIIMVWICSIPLWYYVFENLMNLPNPKEVFSIVIKLLPFYIFYMLSATLDSIFIGLGKTKYLFLNAIIVDIIYYGIVFMLFTLEVITPSMNFIILMFGFGMVIHFVVSVIFTKVLLNKNRQQYINMTT